MACKQQLAYLDELKERLQQLCQRQETFMEQTAEMLRCISNDQQTAPQKAATSLKPSPETASIDECPGGIKQLIQRFEDLRQTSRQFTEEPLPEELAGVDVRKLLKGYEQLIVEGNLLQRSWLLLKTTTEHCAHPSNRAERMSNKTSSKSPSFAEPASGPNHNTVQSMIISLSTTSGFASQAFEQKSGRASKRKARGQRFGALLQLALRISRFKGRRALMGPNNQKP